MRIAATVFHRVHAFIGLQSASRSVYLILFMANFAYVAECEYHVFIGKKSNYVIRLFET